MEPSEGPPEVRVWSEPGPGDKDARWSEFSVSSVAAQVAEAEMMQGQWPVSCLCSFVCEQPQHQRHTLPVRFMKQAMNVICFRLVKIQDIGMH